MKYIINIDYLAQKEKNNIIVGYWYVDDVQKFYQKGTYVIGKFVIDMYNGTYYFCTEDGYRIPSDFIDEITEKKSKWKMPTIELVKFDKKKGVTVVKFKEIKKAVKAKCNPKEKFNEYEGLVTCLLKQSSGMSNQELKRYLEHAEKKTIK